MTDLNAFNATSTAGGGPSKYLVKNSKKELELVDVDRNDLDTPAKGFYPKLQLKGIAEPFDMPSRFKTNQDGTPAIQRMTRALIRVVAQGTPNHNKTFTQLFPMEGISARSQFGQILGAIRGRDLGVNEAIDWADFLGGSFGAMVATEEKTDGQGFDVVYGKVVKDTVVPAEAKAEAVPTKPASVPPASPFDVDDDGDSDAA